MADRRGRVISGLLAALAVTACDTDGQGAAASGADPETLALGQAIYAEHCASCHGPSGEGAPDWEQTTAAGEMPAPPHDSTGHTWRHSDALLYRIVEQGWRDPFNRTERLTMPRFEDTLDPSEIRAVLEYIKTLWTPEQRQFQAAESQDNPYPEPALER